MVMPVGPRIALATDLCLGFLLNFLRDLEVELDSEITKDLFLVSQGFSFWPKFLIYYCMLFLKPLFTSTHLPTKIHNFWLNAYLKKIKNWSVFYNCDNIIIVATGLNTGHSLKTTKGTLLLFTNCIVKQESDHKLKI